MLPSKIALEDLDVGVRDLVVNLNRIPGVYTYTTCEGHIWRDCFAWPTKDGWVHFNVPKNKHEGLVKGVKRFVEWHPTFKLEDWGEDVSSKEHIAYTMNALFESHDNGNLFGRLNASQRRNYFRRAETRLRTNLNGWADLNGVVIQYLTENFGDKYTQLPFRYPEVKGENLFVRCMH